MQQMQGPSGSTGGSAGGELARRRPRAGRLGLGRSTAWDGADTREGREHGGTLQARRAQQAWAVATETPRLGLALARPWGRIGVALTSRASLP